MSAKRILLVDDEEEFLKVMRIRLSSWGYDVITASTAKEAVLIAKRSKDFLDAVILDIVMEDMDGIEALRRIRRFDKRIPVFMLTAYGDDESFRKVRRLGISGFVHKTGKDDVAEAIRIVLRGVRKKA